MTTTTTTVFPGHVLTKMGSGFLICVVLCAMNLAVVRGEICLICECAFVNVSKVEPKSHDRSHLITFEYRTESVEPFDANTTYGPTDKYFYVDCSSESNVGQITNLEWPKVRVAGIFGNFRSSKWRKFETFPANVKKEMTVLSLANNLIAEMDEFELEDFNRLKMLNLTGNEIERVRKGTFAKVNPLKILDLSGNRIGELEDWSFYGTQLRYLNLSRNHIASLTPDVFRGLINLTVLDLSLNRLTKVPDEFGNMLPSLNLLLVRNNGFQVLPELPKELKKLDADWNRLVDLRLTHSNLEILFVSHNEILSLDNTNFPSLKVLKASHNNLTGLTVLKSDRVAVLHLSHNKFTRIPEVIDSDKLPYLEELHLDYNPIENITFPVLREPFSNLRTLSLSHMKKVKRINRNAFQGIFPKFNYDCSQETGITLDLSHNSIKFVDKEVFQNVSICSLDLSKNHLKTLSGSLLPWRKLSHINLQENPWHCDCNIQWMLDDFMVFMYHHRPRLLFDLRCSTPLRYRNRMFVSWYNRSENVFCNAGPSSFYLDLLGGKKIEIWTASAIAAVALGVVILVIFVAILVLLCTKPRKRKPTNSKQQTTKKSPPFYKQLRNNVTDQHHDVNEKYV